METAPGEGGRWLRRDRRGDGLPGGAGRRAGLEAGGDERQNRQKGEKQDGEVAELVLGAGHGGKSCLIWRTPWRPMSSGIGAPISQVLLSLGHDLYLIFCTACKIITWA